MQASHDSLVVLDQQVRLGGAGGLVLRAPLGARQKLARGVQLAPHIRLSHLGGVARVALTARGLALLSQRLPRLPDALKRRAQLRI